MDAEPAGNKGSAAEDLEVQARRQRPKASSAKTSRGYLERKKHLKDLTCYANIHAKCNRKQLVSPRIKNRDDIFGFHCTPQQMEATLKQTLLTSQRVNPYALKNHLKAHVSRLKDARNKSPLRQHNAIKTSGFNANS